MNIKVKELIKMYNFIFSSYDKVVLTLFTKFTYLQERYIIFVNNITTTILDEQITKIKVVDLGKL
jgi:hypothetical protein